MYICYVAPFKGIEDKIKVLHWKITEKNIKTEPHDGSKTKVIRKNFVFAMARKSLSHLRENCFQ
jgi:hypothetical protein